MRKGIALFILSIILMMTAGCGQGIKQVYSLEGHSVVWGDYERSDYHYYVNDNLSQPIYYEIEKGMLEGREVFHIDFGFDMEEGFIGTGTVIDAASLRPLSAYNKQIPPAGSGHPKREIIGVYEQNKLNVTMKVGDKEQKLPINIPDNIIDNESSLMMVRSLPLEEGFSANIMITIIASAQAAPYRVTVAAIEEVEVPYGVFNCYKVVYEFTGRGTVPSMIAWYTADEDKIMVKYTNQNVRFELIDFHTERGE